MEYGVFISNQYGKTFFLEYSNEFKPDYRVGKECNVYHCLKLKDAPDLNNQTFQCPFEENRFMYQPEGKQYWLTTTK